MGLEERFKEMMASKEKDRYSRYALSIKEVYKKTRRFKLSSDDKKYYVDDWGALIVYRDFFVIDIYKDTVYIYQKSGIVFMPHHYYNIVAVIRDLVDERRIKI